MLPIERDIIKTEALIKKHNSGNPEDERDDIQELQNSLKQMREDLVDYELQRWKDSR